MTIPKSDKQLFEEWQGNAPMGSFSKGRVLNFMKMARRDERERLVAKPIRPKHPDDINYTLWSIDMGKCANTLFQFNLLTKDMCDEIVKNILDTKRVV